MNYAKKGSLRAPIEYYCEDCSFTTFDKFLEEEHFSVFHHFTRSRVRSDMSEEFNE